MSIPSISIVGGGFAGAAVAINLLRFRGDKSFHLRIIEPERIGCGVAYSTQENVHLLNVPAAGMGIFHDRVTDFHEWVNKCGRSCLPGEFLPRVLYGQYVEETFRNATAQNATGAALASPVEIVSSRAIALHSTESGGSLNFMLTTADGRTHSSDFVVLALGNGLFSALEGSRECSSRFISAFDYEKIKTVSPKVSSVMILGSGLTAVDAVLLLEKYGFSGNMQIISRRGLLPQSHQVYQPTGTLSSIVPKSLRRLTAEIRSRANSVQELGGNWREAIDSQRQETPVLWAALSSADKARFLRHVRPYWDAHRHRMPSAVYEQLRRLQAEGRLTVFAGRVRDICSGEEQVRLKLIPRGNNKTRSLECDLLIDARGFLGDIRKSKDPLVKSLQDDKSLSFDPQGLGVCTNELGQLLGGEGKANPKLYGLGILRRGELWESTAVPEIRQQAFTVASSILAQIEPGS